jgi:PIN domain nuclease of toxin-antitoxin system
VILLDTHAALWFATKDITLGKISRSLALQALADSQLSISAISFWEIALLIAKRRLDSLDSAQDVRVAMLDAGIIELPLTGDVCVQAVALTGLPGDPADRFIAATAVSHGATLITADEALLRWSHAVDRQNAMQ